MVSELFIARLPPLSNVEVYEAELAVVQRQGPFLQLLKSKCRELARSESCLLVSPTTAALHCGPAHSGRPPATLWIMARAGYLGNEKLQAKLKHLGIKVVGRVGLSEGLLQTCYQFSLTARLAPKWNLLSHWLVQGMEFLSTGRSHAVVLEVGVTRTEITLSVSVSRIIFNFLQPSDLGVSVNTLSAFLADPHAVIRETSIYQNRCILLPNLTVGYVFSASHQLPSSPAFPTYDSIRLHWKKQHGMILPEKQAVFFQIFFKSNSRTFFSYPGCCVLKAPPTVTPGSRDSRGVAGSFVADLHSRMPSLCGEPIRYSSKALTPLAHLLPAATPTAYPNIRATPGPSRSSCLTTPTSLGAGKGTGLIRRASAALASSSSGHVTTSHSGHVTTPNGRPSGHMTTPNGNHSGHMTTPNGSGHIQTVPGSGPHSQRGPSRDGEPSSSLPSVLAQSARGRIVPVFRPAQHPRLPQPQSTATKSAPIVPSFKPSRALPRAQTVPSSPATGQQRSQANRQRPSSSLPSPDQQSQPLLGKRRGPTSLPLPPHKKQTHATNLSSSSAGRSGVQSRAGGGRGDTPLRNLATVSGSEQTVPDLSRTQTNTHFLSNSVVEHQQSSVPCETSHSSLKKAKGVKTALRVDGVDAETMKKISKVKAPLLKRWLQESGVKVTGRKTKEELVKMAAQHTSDTGTAFTPPS